VDRGEEKCRKERKNAIKYNKRLSISITEEQFFRVQELSEKQGLTISCFIRRMIESSRGWKKKEKNDVR
jgi:predicted DNA binding CopG/RHH family protein